MQSITILFLFICLRISSSFCKYKKKPRLKEFNFEENDSFKKVCNDGSNPCQLDQSGLSHAYFLPINGYYCLDGFDGEIICTCPDNSTRRNRPCRKI